MTHCRISYIGGAPAANINGFFGIVSYGGSRNMVANCVVSQVNDALEMGAIGIQGNNTLTVRNCDVSDITSPSGPTSGIQGATFAVGNTVANMTVGILNSEKYQNNLASAWIISFAGGSDCGGNF